MKGLLCYKAHLLSGILSESSRVPVLVSVILRCLLLSAALLHHRPKIPTSTTTTSEVNERQHSSVIYPVTIMLNVNKETFLDCDTLSGVFFVCVCVIWGL